ncbi:MAG: ribonuclease HII [Proteobacteria bacterium ST_bin13]|nr:MAG: ribonuclease HII [Proteobacteria bacterium ST_bin13]
MIAGVDEAGRGPLAGPVVAAAVILCPGGIAGLNDSKKLSAAQRERLFATIVARCTVGIGMASVAEIDSLNILWATMLAMERAVAGLGVAPDDVLVDGNRCPDWRWRSRAIIGGDAIEPCISAASIVAKVTRDRIMVAADRDYPGYGWASNKGYGARVHLDALARLGPTPLHRRSFAPVARAYLDR